MYKKRIISLFLLLLCFFLYINKTEASAIDSTVGIEFSAEETPREGTTSNYINRLGAKLSRGISKYLPQTGEEVANFIWILIGILLLVLVFKSWLSSRRKDYE